MSWRGSARVRVVEDVVAEYAVGYDAVVEIIDGLICQQVPELILKFQLGFETDGGHLPPQQFVS